VLTKQVEVVQSACGITGDYFFTFSYFVHFLQCTFAVRKGVDRSGMSSTTDKLLLLFIDLSSKYQ
jgi:hypothetical protein